MGVDCRQQTLTSERVIHTQITRAQHTHANSHKHTRMHAHMHAQNGIPPHLVFLRQIHKAAPYPRLRQHTAPESTQYTSYKLSRPLPARLLRALQLCHRLPRRGRRPKIGVEHTNTHARARARAPTHPHPHTTAHTHTCKHRSERTWRRLHGGLPLLELYCTVLVTT